MRKLQVIIDKAILNWWKPRLINTKLIWNWLMWFNYIDWRWDESTVSINDILSIKSWFMQAVKWKYWSCSLSYYKMIWDSGWVRDDSKRQYHSMMLSILSDEEKIKYLEDNVIID